MGVEMWDGSRSFPTECPKDSKRKSQLPLEECKLENHVEANYNITKTAKNIFPKYVKQALQKHKQRKTGKREVGSAVSSLFRIAYA